MGVKCVFHTVKVPNFKLCIPSSINPLIPLHILLFCSVWWKSCFPERDSAGETLSFFGVGFLTHVYLSHVRSTAANSQRRQRHRRSSLRHWSSWRCTCHRKSGTRASRAPSTRWNTRCGASSRWKVSLVSRGPSQYWWSVDKVAFFLRWFE